MLKRNRGSWKFTDQLYCAGFHGHIDPISTSYLYLPCPSQPSTAQSFSPEGSYYLLQGKLASQMPFHVAGGGPYPMSEKLANSGRIPVSKTPMMMSLSVVDLLTLSGNPMKSHELVVATLFFKWEPYEVP
ncbi:hypothetical protein Ccrd_005875 [Cynara cardunculus var. scolymus]|uniref:Uncharacterized protein n=1 Tax=Cynara cardunculus var. scolymus TaxID=59895 RepID=A0A118JUV8_CYNCS|nr:hypothetical protein Ccrd_005875 [Cynara cardunculus var. scolymus]